MNDSTKCANGLLVLRYPMPLSSEQLGQLTNVITPVADALGVEPLVLDGGADARLEFGSASVLERLCVAVERLVQQGEPPAAPEQVEAPVLNARPSGLNSRPAGVPPPGILNVPTEGTYVLQPGEKVTPNTGKDSTLKADMERSFHEREHRQLGKYLADLGKLTDG